jgi:hypothetical protein
LCFARWNGSRDLLYNIVPIVNNTLLCTLKYSKRLNLTLSVLTRRIIQKTWENFGCKGYVHYLGHGVRIMSTCPNLLRCKH